MIDGVDFDDSKAIVLKLFDLVYLYNFRMVNY